MTVTAVTTVQTKWSTQFGGHFKSNYAYLLQNVSPCNANSNEIFYNLNFLHAMNLVTAVTALKSSSKITSYFCKLSPKGAKRLTNYFLFKMSMPPINFSPQNIFVTMYHILLNGIFRCSNSSDMKVCDRCFLLIICLAYFKFSTV